MKQHPIHEPLQWDSTEVKRLRRKFAEHVRQYREQIEALQAEVERLNERMESPFRTGGSGSGRTRTMRPGSRRS